MNHLSKFRAYQLDSPGSLFSYYKNNVYTLIEARIPKGGIQVLINDMSYHEKDRIDTLHITSWDTDHCTFNDLVSIINHLRPQTIEIPEYETDTNEGKLCRSLILRYDDIHERYVQNVKVINQAYLIKRTHISF